MAENKRKPCFKDNGITVADMNADGMPRYARRKNNVKHGGKEKRLMLFGAISAAFTVYAACALMYLLFILFCTRVWLV